MGCMVLNLDSVLQQLRPRRRKQSRPKGGGSNRELQIYVYDIPKRYRPTKELALVSETFYAIDAYFRTYCRTTDPSAADYFYVPLNLIQFQFRGQDPGDIVAHLPYYNPKNHDHLLVAAGDFSNRSRTNHHGEAYPQIYDWLDGFTLLALESTSDLIYGQDIGIMPINTLVSQPVYNTNPRCYLYSFLGELHHALLPKDHIREQVATLPIYPDALIARAIDPHTRARLKQTYSCVDDFELVARNSVFTLCPAGYGRWTYRLFQAIQWGSIPVLLSDDYVPPFGDTIPWDTFCIRMPERNIATLDAYLRTMSAEDVARYQAALRRNQHWFTPDSFFALLTKELERQAS